LSILSGHEGPVNGVVELEGSAGFLSWGADGTLRLWSPEGRGRAVARGHSAAITRAIVFDGSASVLSLSNDYTMKLWRMCDLENTPSSDASNVVIGALSLDPRWGYVSWNHRTLWISRPAESSPISLNAHKGRIIGALAVPGRGGVLSWDSEGFIHLWDANGNNLRTMTGHEGAVRGAVALQHSRGFLSWSDDQTLRFWTRDGKIRRVLCGHRDRVTGAKALDDGRFLSWSDDGTLRLWGPKGGTHAVLRNGRLPVKGAYVLRNKNGYLSWSRQDYLNEEREWGINLWNPDGSIRCRLNATSQTLGMLELKDGAGYLSWEFGNSLDWDGLIRLWGPDGEMISKQYCHEGTIRGVIELEGSAGFLSWSDMGEIIAWNPDLSFRQSFQGHIGAINGILMLPGGQGTISWGTDGMLRLWNNEGELKNLWLTPDGGISHVEIYNMPDEYLVVFGQYAGIVRLPALSAI